MREYNYREFPAGNNIWKKSARFLFLNFERLITLGVYFAVTYLALMTAFSYQLTASKVLFVCVMVVAAIYSILPAPSNPNSILFFEVFLRGAKVIQSQNLRSTFKTNPIEAEED